MLTGQHCTVTLNGEKFVGINTRKLELAECNQFHPSLVILNRL
jgi:hypothetical protein